MRPFILVIDQGTTGTGVSLVDQAGKIVATYDQEFEQIFPEAGWVEHSPEGIWKTIQEGIVGVIKKAGVDSGQIKAIGITNQRETTVAWDKQGHSLCNAIVWQCRRTSERCQKLKKTKWSKYIKQVTGLVTDPYFSATKMEWMLKNVVAVKSAAKSKTLHFGTIDSFIIFKLTDGEHFKTDVSNASRTMLMGLKTLNWDQKLLKLFGLKPEYLPEICPSGASFGTTKNILGLPDGVPICGVLGDQQSALFGQLALSAGEAKVTYGTGSFILVNTGNQPVQSKKGLLTTLGWQISKKTKPIYALEGGAFICGAAVQWLRDGLKVIQESHQVEQLAMQVPDTNGAEFVPAFAGLGAPYWNPDVRGAILGLTRGVTHQHIARATLEAMALQNVEILLAMKGDMKKNLKTLRVDGGASQNNLLMQIQADYMGVPVERPKQVETTTLGAAFMAGLSAGIWKSTDELKSVWQLERKFEATISKRVREVRLKKWQSAIKRLS